MTYKSRLDGPGVEGSVLDRLRDAGPAVEAAELRSLKGLKQRT